MFTAVAAVITCTAFLASSCASGHLRLLILLLRARLLLLRLHLLLWFFRRGRLLILRLLLCGM
tara:strand:+ start:327 stop:515 length:189 start_codon:yes stop_codon:yes gene_type:complete